MNEYVLESKENLNYFYRNLNETEVNQFVDILIQHKDNNIYFLGIGKSFNVSSQCSDVLKCINFSSMVLETSKILHGDIGIIKENDLIITISNSGNTAELMNILNIIYNSKNKNIVLLSSNKNGKLLQFSKYNFIVPHKSESKFLFSLIPSLSVINHIQYFNIVAGIIIKKMLMTKDIYIQNHHSGNIGLKYKKIKDYMIIPEKCSIMSPINTIKELIISMNYNEIACAVVENENKKVIAFITDKDIRNYIEKNDNLTENIKVIMNQNFYYIEDEHTYINELKKNYKYIPVIKNNKLLGVFYNNSFL